MGKSVNIAYMYMQCEGENIHTFVIMSARTASFHISKYNNFSITTRWHLCEINENGVTLYNY